MGKIYELDSKTVHGIKQDIPDSLNTVQEQEKDLKWTIITDLK